MSKLELVEKLTDVRACQNQLETIITNSFQGRNFFTLGFPGGNWSTTVQYGSQVWFSTHQIGNRNISPRIWNGFGLAADLDPNRSNNIVVEINIPTNGINRRVSGFYAIDKCSGEIFLMHRGRIGGGRPGIGKDNFVNWYGQKFVQVYSSQGVEDALLVAKLSTNNFEHELHHFVDSVKQFKLLITSSAAKFPSHKPTKMQLWMQAKQDLMTPGTPLPPWPKVIISDDDPPLFKIDPFYKRMYEEDCSPPSASRMECDHHREHGRERERNRELEEIPVKQADTERLLGCYYFNKKQIVLWRKGIKLCAARLLHPDNKSRGVPIQALTDCVLVHELGHWFNAEAITPNNIAWDTTPLTITAQPAHQEQIAPLDPYDLSSPPSLTGDARSLSSRAYHEAWAQLFAWLYGHEQDQEVLRVFEILENRQSEPYQAWRQLVNPLVDPLLACPILAYPWPSTDSDTDTIYSLFKPLLTKFYKQQEQALGQAPYTISDLRWPLEHILSSLEWSRSLRDPKDPSLPAPATFSDPNFKHTNMLSWL
jgi:hypothetical protein